MRVGIATEETWGFLNEIHEELTQHHTVSVFQRRRSNLPVLNTRVNRSLFNRDLRAFTQANQVIFFEWASELLAVASHLPKRCGIVTRLHRYEMYRWADQINWDAVDKVILVSRAKENEFQARFPAQADKIAVIPEAISLQRFSHRPRCFNGDIGILCHLRPRKRVYELILAFYELSRQRDDFHLHIGGGEAPGLAEYFQAIQILIQKLSLQDKVTIYGHVKNPEEWYQHVDIFISNSYSEGLQVAPMEAIASGCYCLAHYWDGADELLPAENLYFSDSELIEKILSYSSLTEAERLQRQSRLRQLVVDQFDVDKTKVQIRQLIEAAGQVV
jgi:glycosyltransferase involved in cell wall biosynthesis